MQDNSDIFAERDEKIKRRIHQFWIDVLPLYEYRDKF